MSSFRSRPGSARRSSTPKCEENRISSVLLCFLSLSKFQTCFSFSQGPRRGSRPRPDPCARRTSLSVTSRPWPPGRGDGLPPGNSRGNMLAASSSAGGCAARGGAGLSVPGGDEAGPTPGGQTRTHLSLRPPGCALGKHWRPESEPVGAGGWGPSVKRFGTDPASIPPLTRQAGHSAGESGCPGRGAVTFPEYKVLPVCVKQGSGSETPGFSVICMSSGLWCPVRKRGFGP